MTYSSRGRTLTEVILAVVFVGFLTGFVAVLCIGNYFRAKRAMERQRQRRLAKMTTTNNHMAATFVEGPFDTHHHHHTDDDDNADIATASPRSSNGSTVDEHLYLLSSNNNNRPRPQLPRRRPPVEGDLLQWNEDNYHHHDGQPQASFRHDVQVMSV